MFRIYNDWLRDFCRHYPDRQIGLACLPYSDIPAAVAEVHRVAKLGLRGDALSRAGYDGIRLHPVAGKCGVFAETDINGIYPSGPGQPFGGFGLVDPNQGMMFE